MVQTLHHMQNPYPNKLAFTLLVQSRLAMPLMPPRPSRGSSSVWHRGIKLLLTAISVSTSVHMSSPAFVPFCDPDFSIAFSLLRPAPFTSFVSQRSAHSRRHFSIGIWVRHSFSFALGTSLLSPHSTASSAPNHIYATPPDGKTAGWPCWTSLLRTTPLFPKFSALM